MREKVQLLQLQFNFSSSSVSVLDTGDGETQFSVRFASNHHSFSLARSVTIRNTEAFYFLQVEQHSYIYNIVWLSNMSIMYSIPVLCVSIYLVWRHALILDKY